VNSNLKRCEHDLSDLNSILRDVNQDARLLAPFLNTENLTAHKKTPPSPIAHKILKGFSSWGAASGAMSAASKPAAAEQYVPEAQPGVPEAQPGVFFFFFFFLIVLSVSSSLMQYSFLCQLACFV